MFAEEGTAVALFQFDNETGLTGCDNVAGLTVSGKMAELDLDLMRLLLLLLECLGFGC